MFTFLDTNHQTFPATVRLRQSGDFRAVRAIGTSRHSRHFLILAQTKADGPTRLGVTVSRKIGGAVKRNRVKRLLREFFRRHYSQLPPQTDLSIIARRGAAELSYATVCGELDFLIECSEPRFKS